MELKSGKTCFYVTRKRQHFSCLSCRQINPSTQQLSVRNWVYPICHLHRRRKCLSILERHRGSASVAGLLVDEDDYVQVIVDKEVAEMNGSVASGN